MAELAKRDPVSAPTISKHVQILVDAGLMTRRKKGRELHCRLVVERIKEAADWNEYYRQVWEQSVDRVDSYLQEVQKKEKTRGRK